MPKQRKIRGTDITYLEYADGELEAIEAREQEEWDAARARDEVAERHHVAMVKEGDRQWWNGAIGAGFLVIFVIMLIDKL